ncbi:hypothetical protein [Paremcibacter congregatus]|uniref:hypothetical protein n=1 Tax=Paremcibacter congregatus TaxID=2043170 RepID=UPI003A957A8A
MGDFTLHHRKNAPADRIDAARQCLASQGSHDPILRLHDSYEIAFYPKQLSATSNVITTDNGDFCGSSGTFIYNGQMGPSALKALLNDFSPEEYRPGDYSGIFTVILQKAGRLFLLTDPLGGNRVYQNSDASFWSSSFLAAATASQKLTPNPQAIYEYAFQETTYGQDTVFHEVTSLDAQRLFEFTPDGLKALPKPLSLQFDTSPRPTADLVEETAEMLKASVRPVAQTYGDRIRTALSGGYDSRLMLALLQEAGVTPGVYVYGPPDNPDVQVARTITAGEGFPLDHTDKSTHLTPPPEVYPDVVQDNFFALDGLPGESIFDFGANMATRRARAGGHHMIFNGGGGEIFRNFFYLPEHPLTGGRFTVNDLINSFYNRYRPCIGGPAFKEADYRAALHDKIQTALGATCDKLSRAQVEYAYPAFRLRYWTCRDNNNNSRLGDYLTPFISHQMIQQALRLPRAPKNHGNFQAALIKAISPALAAYPSDYGYAFDQPVPTKTKLKNLLTYYRPTSLRRYSYALQHQMADVTIPETLSLAYLSGIFPDGLRYMPDYFTMDQVKDPGLRARILSMEYLFQHFAL